jgi:glucan-binding YG repeat protein
MSDGKPNDENNEITAEEIKEELADQLEEIEEELEAAKTPEEKAALLNEIEGIKSWITETVVGPLNALTAELQKANELKAKALETSAQQVLPGQELPGQEEMLAPEEVAENMREEMEQMQEQAAETVKKTGRTIKAL